MDQPESQPLISDRFLINGTLTSVDFRDDGKIRWSDGHTDRCLAVEKEVLGFASEGSRIRIRAIVENGGGLCCVGSRGKLVRKDFVFEIASADSHRLWCQKLREYIDSLETKHQLHAKAVTQTLDLSKYDGLICVSGDGILVEVVNGLLERDDWDSAIKMPIGVIPAGTGNGMAKSLLDSVGDPCSPINAVLAIIRGHKCSLDVATILQGETKFFSVLMLAWGLVADIDIESEKYRWMGSARLDFYALQRILHLRKYNGCISFVPAPGFEAFGEPSTYKGESTSGLNTFNPSQEEPIKVQQHGYQGPNIELEKLQWRTIDGPFVSIWLHNVPWGGEDTLAAPDAKVPLKKMKQFQNNVESGIASREKIYVCGCGGGVVMEFVLSLRTKSLHQSRPLEFSDGYLDLIIIRDCPKLPLLALMSELNKGNHIKSPYVMYFKVKAFVLEPGPCTEDPTKGGIIDSDGEVLARGNGTYKCDQKALMAYDNLQIAVDQGLATVFSPI
ncbi:Sphingosine kinase 1 [Vitis vinifera]|uniref:Sphingosine kinase 1 n=1 Tax=Vitis vinifera TaxID=29760 RepID=A0A438JHX8_VITVI|nr:Sphingosine kinase 1 [Vitis vinifera]